MFCHIHILKQLSIFTNYSHLSLRLKEQVDADVKQQVSKMKNTFELVEGLRMVEYTGLIVPKDDDVTQCVKFIISVSTNNSNKKNVF